MDKLIQIADLLPTHNELRKVSTMCRLIGAVEKNFNLGKVHLVHLTDVDKIIIQDGHHRLVAYYFVGYNFVGPSNYKMSQMTVDDYLDINLDAEWTTPYNPITHVRKADFGDYKNSILALESMGTPRHTLYDLIRASTDVYTEPRKVFSIEDLWRLYQNSCPVTT